MKKWGILTSLLLVLLALQTPQFGQILPPTLEKLTGTSSPSIF